MPLENSNVDLPSNVLSLMDTLVNPGVIDDTRLNEPWHGTGEDPWVLTYSFEDEIPSDIEVFFGEIDISDDTRQTTPEEQELMLAGFREIESYANVVFVEVEPGYEADIKITHSADLYTDLPSVGGGRGYHYYRYWFDTDTGEYTTQLWNGWLFFQSDIDMSLEENYGFFLHELGHALGLRHPGNYDVVADHAPEDPFIPEAFDNQLYTVMSYNENPETGRDADGLMLLDVAALQYFWGANSTDTAGKTVHTFEPQTSNVIYDAGGTDLIRHVKSEAAINLNPGVFMSASRNSELVIAYGTDIENVKTGRYNDLVIGNDLGNKIKTGKGADTLSGNAGNDKLFGGLGRDQFDGGLGRDKMYAGKDAKQDGFVFNSVEESGTTAQTRDVIYQFDVDDDLIVLTGIDANENRNGDQSFKLVDEAQKFSVWSEESKKQSVVYADVDGDAVADFSIALKGVSGLSAENFEL